MKLVFHQPRPDLRDYISSYYIIVSGQTLSEPMCAEMANIRFLNSGKVELTFSDGGKHAFYDATLIGPTMNSMEMRALTPVCVFGVGILPRGWGALFGLGAAELSDTITDLEALCGPAVKHVVEQMRNATHPVQKILAADNFFARLLERNAYGSSKSIRLVFPEVLDNWLLRPHDLKLDVLLQEMDVSRRQTERLAKQFFGASPKRLQRKYRALHAATQLVLQENVSWLDIEGGDFYDQSHFIKEIKAFTGLTPVELISERGGMMAESIKLRARATHKRAVIQAAFSAKL